MPRNIGYSSVLDTVGLRQGWHPIRKKPITIDKISLPGDQA